MLTPRNLLIVVILALLLSAVLASVIGPDRPTQWGGIACLAIVVLALGCLAIADAIRSRW